MNKLLAFLAMLLMACTVMVAEGATYTDNFDGAYPQNPWLVFDETQAAEYWAPGVGPIPDQPGFDVSYGGTATLQDADANPISPQLIGSLLSQPNPAGLQDVVVYAGSVTTELTLNPDMAYSVGLTSDSASIGFVQDGGTYGPGLHFYAVTYSARDHELALFAGRNSGWLLRLDRVDVPVSLLNVPVDCTLQAQAITSGPNTGKTNLVAVCKGDIGNGYEVLAELDAVAGVTTPDYYTGGPSGNASDVPILHGGAVGFGAIPDGSATPIYTSADDFVSRDALVADFDLDGDVDVSDLGILATSYGTSSGMTVLTGDADWDGQVNVNDLGDLATNYGMVVTASAVPEPATMALLCAGGLLLLIRRRWK